ncbi:Gryzun, putative trafficking through golgi-domain-containing protein [Phaeosphaeriaceae sp. PMI808]|nr:Gryzun, putative trafficking through golgi-domain-containing protein [Phaeosphaeriaceae sp. PMI808]
MDEYPPKYLQHNLPFIVLSGLGTTNESDPPQPVQEVFPGRAVTTIHSDIPVVTGDRANTLLEDFLSADSTNAPWNGRTTGRKGLVHGFRIRAVGRLPPKKADAPTTSDTTPPGSPTIAAATSWTLHSPISPLSPASTIFPDGVMAPSWVAKHQDYVPSAYISFFDFLTDPITNSLHDNQLKTEINKIKNQIQKSEYRTRYVVVLLSDKAILEAPDIEERLANIRRTTGLDPKTSLFFLPPKTSPVELPYTQEEQGTIPPPTAPPTRGTSQTLSHPGWGVRYDVKLGVFAEFRQEMDAAQRHYNFALEALFGAEGIFEITASWSPRWDEIRLLADIIALRHIRSSPDVDPPNLKINEVFALPEKQFPIGERLPPWELLHHAGYWQKLSAEHAKRRYLLAREMPEEDRTPPGMSPATRVSNRNQIYDHYLVPQPHEEIPVPGISGGFEHWSDISGKLRAAISAFEARGQYRKYFGLCGKPCPGERKAGGLLHRKFYGLCMSVHYAFKIERPISLLSGSFTAKARVVVPGKTRYKHDLMACLDVFSTDDSSDDKVTVRLDSSDSISCLSMAFAFSATEGNVGEPLRSQITIRSNARSGSAPITLSSLVFQFEGGLSEVQIIHDSDNNSGNGTASLHEITLEESVEQGQKPRWAGASDLMIHAGQTKVFNFPLIFREAGGIDTANCIFEVSTERFDLICSSIELDNEQQPSVWWIKTNSGVKPRKLLGGSAASINILPKPPKMEIRLPDVRNQYYTDEPVTVAIEILNLEDEDTEAVLEVRLLGRSKDTLGYSWVDRPPSSPMKEVPPSLDGSGEMDLPGHVVGKLAQGEKTTEKIRFTAPPDPADYALEVKVLYHLLSDRDIPISKILVADIVFNAPFEASYDLNARVHPDPWPSYFELQEAESNINPESTDAFGIAQKWGLRAKVASFADETLLVKDLQVQVHGVHGGAACDVSKEFEIETMMVEPQVLNEWAFSLDVRKNNLEERRSTALDTTLDITWQRTSASYAPSVTSSLPIPRIQIPSSEPRVLASAILSNTLDSVVHLDYTLENPTMHFLTFELNMEASEEFGFSGSKVRTLHLLPMSRQTVRFNLYALVRGVWVTPNMRVMDQYFNKTLKVQATEGLRTDKKGFDGSEMTDGGKSRASSSFHFFAGLSSGVLSAVLLQPADLLKTRVQQSRSSTLLATIQSIASGPNPIQQFWRGTLPSTLRTGCGSAIYFSSLNALRRRASLIAAGRGDVAIRGGEHSSSLPKLSNTANLATGAFARTWAGFVMMPITVLKVRYESSLYSYTSLLSASKDIFRTEGFKGFFAGFGATAVRDAPYAGLYVLFYEQSKRRLSTVATRIEESTGATTKLSSSTSAGINFVSGVAAAGLGTTFTNPFDAIKTRIQLMPDRYANMVQAAKKMFAEEGTRSFFDGLGIRIARKAVSSALAWTVYEELIRRAEQEWREVVEEQIT